MLRSYNHDSDSCIVRSVVNYGIYVGCMFSPVGRNVLMCCCKYGVPVQCRPNPSTVIWENYLRGVLSELKVQTSVLYDMVLERESAQTFLTRDKIDTIIDNICSN